MAEQNRPSLYERLGGVYSIATVVDDFIDRIMTDARLNANPLVDEAHHRVPPGGFKYLVTEMVCWASGGPQTPAARCAIRIRSRRSPPASGMPSSTISRRRWTSSECPRQNKRS